MEEIWKEIPGYPGYLISNLGRVKSFRRKGFLTPGVVHETKFRFLGLVIKEDSQGYRSVVVKLYSAKGKAYRFILSRLLYELFISPIPVGYVVDHKDHNSLNNALENLRLATRAENTRNRVRTKTKTSDLPKGVFPVSTGFTAAICIDRRQINLGRFKTAEEAADAYNKAATMHHGEFAKLNITKEIIQ